MKIKSTQSIAYADAINELQIQEGDTILDYGCGGNNSRSLRVLTRRKVELIGTDHDPKLVLDAQTKYPNHNFFTHNGTIPLPDSCVDSTLSAFVHLEIRSLEEMQRVNEEIARILKPNGRHVILTTNPKMWGKRYKRFHTLVPDSPLSSGAAVQSVTHTTPPVTFNDTYWTLDDYHATSDSSLTATRTIFPELSQEETETIPPYMVLTYIKK